jgi:uncharacterized membrane protein YbhN (UPF0104 family)
VGFYVLSHGLKIDGPSVLSHFLIVPLGFLANALPLTPAGIGTFEAAMDFLYQWASGDQLVGQGFLVALAYRVVVVGLAAVGAVLFFVRRREVTELLQEAETIGASAANASDHPPS